MQNIGFNEIADRLKGVFGVKSDAALAKALGMKPTAFNNRKLGGSIPYAEIHAACMREGISLDLVFGVGNGETVKGEALSKDERELVHDFRSLNKEDRQAVRRHATALNLIGK